MADHLFQWLPYVALNQESQLSFGKHNFLEMLSVAAAHIYNTKKTESRGELGELLLHIACVQVFKTIPVLCKLILKTSSNDTVKGFDGVHVVVKNDGFELWLGESKFYSDPKKAIRDAVKSVREHIVPSFLTVEKAMLIGHVAKDIPRRDEIIHLFKSQTSGDKLLDVSVFPVFIAYESETVSSFEKLSEKYVEELRGEVSKLKVYFKDKVENLPLRFQLIFFPMASKSDVIEGFDKKLKAFV